MDVSYVLTDAGNLKPTVPADISAEANIDFINAYLTQWEGSEQRQFMDVCEKYYANKNDVLNNRRKVIGRSENNEAILKESKVLANNKLCHNFLQKLTKQKLGYVISRKFTIDLEKPDDELGKQMIEDVSKYYTKNFHKTIKNCARDAVVNSLGWLQVYYDEQGNLRFKRIPSREVAPIWTDIDHEELSGIIRKYAVDDYSSGKKVEHKYVEYYTKDAVYYYEYNSDGNLIVDTTLFETGVGPHYFSNSVDTGNYIGEVWGKVPFIPFKYNSDETTLLAKIKTLIDDYDKKTSEVSNNIEDLPNSILVIKNYDGESKEEFVQNKNEYRTIFVQGDGGAESIETPLSIDQIDLHLQRLREDIYEFGQGVNTADKDIRDTSGVALRFLYADLDMDCADWTPELECSIMSALDFILLDIKRLTGKDYSSVEYSILFNTDIIINETETITNCFTSKGIISDKTIAANHPWTRNVDKEMSDMKTEDIEELKLEQQYGKEPSNTLDGQIRSTKKE